MDSKRIETIGVLCGIAAMVGIYAWYTFDSIKRGEKFNAALLQQGIEEMQGYQRGYLDAKKTYEQPKKEKRHETKKA